MKLEEYRLAGCGFGILSGRIQVQTVGRSLAGGNIELSMVRLIVNGEAHLFWWFGSFWVFFVVFICVFFSFNYLQIKDEVFEPVTAMCNIQFFSVKLGKRP